MIQKKEVIYKTFGKCLEISNGSIRLVVTTDIGPRIICFSRTDGENILFEDNERVFFRDEEEICSRFGKDRWYTYGGHRLWVSPEAFPRSYYPDSDPVSVRLTENGAVFTPPEQKWNQQAHSIEIMMEEKDDRVRLIHHVKNTAAFPVELAIWPITILSAGGTEIVPVPTKDTGLLSNRLLALWPYTRMTDPRVHWGDKYITLRQDESIKELFKFGISSEHGFSMYLNHGDIFIKEFVPVAGGHYPDGGMSFETYTNHLFLEMETLGELQTILPGSEITHEETWSLRKGSLPSLSEADIDAAVLKYIS